MTTTEPSSYLQINPVYASLDSTTLIYLFVILLLLVVSALMSGSESAFFSLKPSDTDEFKKENPNENYEKLVREREIHERECQNLR